MKFVQASINTRLVAMGLDFVFIIILESIFASAISKGFELLPEWCVVVIFICLTLMLLFYWPICETLMHGQTLGKKIMKVRVVRTDGSPASAINCLQRFLVMPFDTFLSMGMGAFISMVVSKKKQRLGDIVADTMVIQDRPQTNTYNKLYYYGSQYLSPDDYQYVVSMNPYLTARGLSPLQLAEYYRATETRIANLRMHKAHEELIQLEELVLSDLHVQMYQRQSTTFTDMVKVTLKHIPRAVYESRMAILLSLAICIIGSVIGVFSQIAQPDFLKDLLGREYYEMTLNNIEEGTPMAVYNDEDAWGMFYQIFLNNFLVCVQLYAMGLIVLVGPLFYLISNFVMVGSFVTFFGQYDCLTEAFVTIHQHGILELSSIIVAGGAAIRLGTGWLFPGKTTRLKAFIRGARQSLMILITTFPMLLIAAAIESFVTRHTEWPMSLRVTILIVSSLLIVTYYVVLPILARRD